MTIRYDNATQYEGDAEPFNSASFPTSAGAAEASGTVVG